MEATQPPPSIEALLRQPAVAAARAQGIEPLTSCADPEAALCRALSDDEQESQRLTPQTVAWAVATLNRAGVACLRNVVPADEVSAAAKEFASTWDAFLEGAVKPYEARYPEASVGSSRFKEVVTRGPGRYDVAGSALGGGGGEDEEDEEEEEEGLAGEYFAGSRCVKQVMTAGLGKGCTLFGKGCVVAMPGAEDQPKHVDSPHLFDPKATWLPAHHFTVFMPLVDITAKTGCTRYGIEWCSSTRVTGSESNLLPEFVPTVESFFNVGTSWLRATSSAELSCIRFYALLLRNAVQLNSLPPPLCFAFN